MKNNNSKTIILIIFFCFISLIGISCDQDIYIEKNDEGVLVKEGKKNVLFYQQVIKSKGDKYARTNYVHPLYSLDGEILTEDFPEDHLHHRGIFWAWHQIYINDQEISNSWDCKNFICNVIDVNSENYADYLLLKIETLWKSPLLKSADDIMIPYFSEFITIRVFKSQDHYRLIDFNNSLSALVDNVSIGGSNNEKGYGGFSVRVFLPEDITFMSENKVVIPEKNSIEAGPWMDLSGSCKEDNSRKWGITIFCHPENPGYPERWILRQRRSMQNPVYPGRDRVSLQKEKATILRYRLMVHDGKLSSTDMDQIYQEYIKTN
jgi:hypothetical protein